MKSRQRQALLTIYANLDPDMSGAQLIQDEDALLRGQGRADFYRWFSESLEEPIIRGASPPRGQLSNAVRTALEGLGGPLVLIPHEDGDIERNEQRRDDLAEAVLVVEVLEALLALARFYSFGEDDGVAFSGVDELQHLAARTVGAIDGNDDVDIQEFLLHIHATAWTPEYLELGPRWYGRQAIPGVPLIGDGDPDAPRNTIELLGTAAGGNEPIPNQFITVAESQPGVRCQAQLVPIILGDGDGEGEYAVFIRTDVEPKQWPPPGCGTEEDFVDGLFTPEQWPWRHDLWCAMTKVDDVQDLHAKLVESKPDPPQPGGYRFGAVLDQCPISICETVGGCDHGGSFPNTVLVFADSRTNIGKRTDYYLEYRLHREQPEATLARDDGVVHVCNHLDKAPAVRLITTKLVYIHGSPDTSEGQILAEFACVSGWGEQTRKFLLTC